jgi:hypothetical protein
MLNQFSHDPVLDYYLFLSENFMEHAKNGFFEPLPF